ncbi:DUF1236 domain-containing protein [Consotaella aegiceratis]|uniref:DUF1236 domain-containing protein n=1 Tax=Consotaella aegiceratis TaxID=3097961 RepID=UPI002F412F0C
MKIHALLAGAAILAATATPSLAQTAVSATTDLNVRAGPGPTFPVIGVIPAGGSAALGGCTETGNWCQVSASGQQGWVYSQYLTADMSGQQVVIVDHRADLQVPVTTYENDPGGEMAGATTGAIAGAIIGGPVGAAVGGAAGLATGALMDPPEQRVQYVQSNPVDPVYLEGEAVVGSRLPDTVVLHQIPDYNYEYVYVNGQPVLVDPGNRQIVYVVR